MKILVVTTYNNKLLQEYAYRFESTFCWPFDKKVYNEDGDLLVVGKLGQPVRMSDETDTTFILRWDT